MITISAIIPTPGRGRPLARCLKSIEPQLVDGDEVIVVGDTHGGLLPEVEALVASFGEPFRYLEHDAGYWCWGHAQINAGMAAATGDYLTFNDDDDIYTPDAFEMIRAYADAQITPRPLLFKFRSYTGGTYWDEGCRQPDGSLVATEEHIGGHCLVCPNLPGKVGQWSYRYQGDYDFIRSTLDLWPRKDADAVWSDVVIAFARPEFSAQSPEVQATLVETERKRLGRPLVSNDRIEVPG